MGNPKVATLSLEAKDSAPLLEISSTSDFGVRGWWLGLEQEVRVGDEGRLILAGAYLLPTTKTADSTDLIVATPLWSRPFDASYQWWFLDGSGIVDLSSVFAVIGGFRFDTFETHLKNPPTLPFYSFPADEGDVRIKSYIPYVGVQTKYDSGVSSITARLVGFPWVGGTCRSGLTYGNPAPPVRDSVNGKFSKGYFLEASCDYSRRVAVGKFGMGAIGAFAKVCVIHSRGSATFSATTAPVGTEQDTFDVTFHRSAIVVGGNVSILFSSPL
jgi:hypothetical protein